MKPDKTPKALKIDERNHVEKPLLDQLAGLGWEILDLERGQKPSDSYRETFRQVVLFPVLRSQLQTINPWLEDDQAEEVIKQLTAHFPSNNLLENNGHIFNLLQLNPSVSENRQTGETSPNVTIIDFERPANNRYIAVCQFKVRILGTENHIIPDIVLFLNGLPVVVIECKSPKTQEPIPEAIDQMMRYSEQRGNKGEGNPELFYFNQFIIATCRNQAKFGTITTRTEKYFYRWADPYPRTLEDLDHGSSSPNDQQRLVAGMCDRANLLEIIHNFTLFRVNDKGETLKIVGRYQQFRAVKKAVQRLLNGRTPRERSGIIWHTQGSGKSLTMMFMVRAMYRHPNLSQWKVVFITDRTNLEHQLSDTGKGAGFTVNSANSIAKLKELLRSDSSNLVMGMIHKFQERDLEETFPELNSSTNILIMIDEAHRSQYSLLAANLDRALPNATRIGYTGTPIDKTEKVFGDYIDKYTMRESIEDKVTLQIVYEGRTQNAEVGDRAAMDADFQDVFSDYTLSERLKILGYGSRDAYLEAHPIIAAKAKDMVAHYVRQIFPNGYKAQVVATSREAAVRYKQHLDAALVEEIRQLEISNPHNINLERLKRLKTNVVISEGGNDKPDFKPYTNSFTHKTIIKNFKLPFDGKEEGTTGDIGIIIVNNMLLTGFDAPIEQVLYLDKVIQSHNLLQAIARVNRVAGEGKEKGFVVDYVGIGHYLKRALDSYDDREQREIEETLSFPEEEIRQLETDYRAVMDLLESYGLKDLSDYDAFYDVFYDEEIRFKYIQAFKQLTRSLNLVYPAKAALNYQTNYKALAEINVLASRHFRDTRLSMKGIPEKLCQITDAHLESRGIFQKVKPISILDDKFESEVVTTHRRTKNKAAAIEHALRDHIEIDLDDDPELQASFAAALAEILEQFKDNWEKIYEELEKLRHRLKEAENEPTYGLHKKKQMPFFRMLKRECFGETELDDDRIAQSVALTQQVCAVVEQELQLTGFWERVPSRKKLEAEIQKVLLLQEFRDIPDLFQNRKQIIAKVMELAEKNNDRILYAE
ncbi:type I restriction endonuclease subunit R [Laspinema sp. D1]|uniref:Type I restriction enzyme endonuclease subunit n=1 Tax=Laspinema palackyanum D2a TaxID=2953684 RepID=A0ABT2MJT5_9CYAN|nr:type I restriction endonuclease subunit R [Laspinema sp. D2a]